MNKKVALEQVILMSPTVHRDKLLTFTIKKVWI